MTDPAPATTDKQGQKRRLRDLIAENGVVVLVTAVVTTLVLVIGAFAAYKIFYDRGSSHQAEPPENPNPKATQSLVVLGDSFASGEGARQFWADSKGCHRTWQSYAYALATEYELRLVFAACSGAVTADFNNKSNGEKPQLAQLSGAHPEIVLVQIGGNDAKFGDLVAACLKANFFHSKPCSAQGFDGRLGQVEKTLETTYRDVVRAAPLPARVFVMGYPNPFGPNYCTASELTNGDWKYVTTTFIPKLDAAVQEAATKIGVTYIPMLDAFKGFALCQLPVGEAALNTISYLSNEPRHDSFHPNAVGQLLFADRIAEVLRSNGFDVPPPEVPVATSVTTTPTATLPPIAKPPSTLDTSPCHAGKPAATLYPVSAADLAHITVTGAVAHTLVCFRADGGAWRRTTSDATGTVVITTPAKKTVEVVFQDLPKTWLRSVYEAVR
jgi:lysophospholipase L1-like esterase